MHHLLNGEPAPLRHDGLESQDDSIGMAERSAPRITCWLPRELRGAVVEVTAALFALRFAEA